MNTTVSARDARRQKKAAVGVSSSTTMPSGPSQEPDIVINGVRNPSDVPIVDVEDNAVSVAANAEVVQGDQALIYTHIWNEEMYCVYV